MPEGGHIPSTHFLAQVTDGSRPHHWPYGPQQQKSCQLRHPRGPSEVMHFHVFLVLSIVGDNAAPEFLTVRRTETNHLVSIQCDCSHLCAVSVRKGKMLMVLRSQHLQVLLSHTSTHLQGPVHRAAAWDFPQGNTTAPVTALVGNL